MPFLLSNIFKKGKILEIVLIFFSKIKKKTFLKVKISKNSRKQLKTQGKNPKLKEKTQPLGFLKLALDPN